MVNARDMGQGKGAGAEDNGQGTEDRGRGQRWIGKRVVGKWISG